MVENHVDIGPLSCWSELGVASAPRKQLFPTRTGEKELHVMGLMSYTESQSRKRVYIYLAYLLYG